MNEFLVEIGYDDHVSYYKVSLDKIIDLMDKIEPDDHNDFLLDNGEYVGDESDFYDMTSDNWWTTGGHREWKDQVYES